MKKKAFVLLIGITLSFLLKAQTLDDYLVIAAENNPGLKAAYAQYLAALERSKQPGLPDPQLQVGFFFKPMERFMGNQQADIQLMQMFPWFGMITAQKDEANKMAKAQYQVFLDEENQLLFQVKSTWYELFRLKEEIRLSLENLEYLKKYERLALIKFQASTPNPTGSNLSNPGNSSAMLSPATSSTGNAGMNAMGGNPIQSSTSNPTEGGMASGGMSNPGPGMSDVLRIRIDINELENTITQLQANLEPLKIKFNQLLNRDIQEEIKIATALEPAKLELGKREILDSIWKNNPMLAMYDAEMAAYDLQTKMVKLDGRPMIGAGVTYMPFTSRLEDGMPMGGEDMVMPMVTMTLPIYRKKFQARIKEADYLKEAAFQNRQKTENLLALEWAAAFRDWEEAERKIQLYSEQTQLVYQNLNLLVTAYSSSGQDFEEVLLAQQRLIDYQLKRINSINQQYQSLAMLEMLASSKFQP